MDAGFRILLRDESEMIPEIAAIVVSSMTGIGLIVTWIKEGRKDTKERTELETTLKKEIKDIKEDINHPKYGLSAIKEKVDEQALYCARTSTALAGRIDYLEKRES